MHSHLTMSEYWKVTINFSFVINTTDSYAFFSSHHLSLPFCPYPSLFHIFCSLSRTTSVSILSKILYLHLLLIICLCFIGFYPTSYCLFVKIFIPPEIFQMFRIIFLHFLICLVHFLVRKMESFLDLTFLFSFINRFAILRTFSEVTLTKKLLYQHKLWTDHILFSLQVRCFKSDPENSNPNHPCIQIFDQNRNFSINFKQFKSAYQYFPQFLISLANWI